MYGSKRLIAIVLLFTLSSCRFNDAASEEDPSLVTIKTDKIGYSANEEITIIIYNGLSETIEYYGACSLTACQSIDGEWMSAIRDCFAPKDLLASGSSTEFKEIFTGTAEDGYRYQFGYYLPSAETLHTVYSNEYFTNP